MITPEIKEQFDQLLLRADEVILLDLAIQGDDAGDPLSEWIENDFPETHDHPLIHAYPQLGDFANPDEYPDVETVIEAMAMLRVSGFLVRVARPVMRYWAGSDGAEYSWGTTNFDWVYGATLADACEQAIAWAKLLDAKQRAKAA